MRWWRRDASALSSGRNHALMRWRRWSSISCWDVCLAWLQASRLSLSGSYIGLSAGCTGKAALPSPHGHDRGRVSRTGLEVFETDFPYRYRVGRSWCLTAVALRTLNDDLAQPRLEASAVRMRDERYTKACHVSPGKQQMRVRRRWKLQCELRRCVFPRGNISPTAPFRALRDAPAQCVVQRPSPRC